MNTFLRVTFPHSHSPMHFSRVKMSRVQMERNEIKSPNSLALGVHMKIILAALIILELNR